jgi:predicted MFS family arabinose efflux permease
LPAVWGFALTSLSAALQSRVPQVAPENSDIASSVYVTTCNLGIAAGRSSAARGGVVHGGLHRIRPPTWSSLANHPRRRLATELDSR